MGPVVRKERGGWKEAVCRLNLWKKVASTYVGLEVPVEMLAEHEICL